MRGAFSDIPKGRASRPFLTLLRHIDPSVQCERRFDWLFLPTRTEMSEGEASVQAALIEHCRSTKHRHVRKATCGCEAMLSDERVKGVSRQLEFDFWLPAFDTGVEFDERQHFTMERRTALETYTGEFPFDTTRWHSLCSDGVNDPDPPCRDWQRAFRDSVRDLRARERGVRLIRIYHRDFDAMRCAEPHANERISQLLKSCLEPTTAPK